MFKRLSDDDQELHKEEDKSYKIWQEEGGNLGVIRRKLVARKAEDERDKEWIKWGEEMCIEHSEQEWPAELGGGTIKRQKMKRRRCQHCWREVKQLVLSATLPNSRRVDEK